jgi:hypothetical protein
MHHKCNITLSQFIITNTYINFVNKLGTSLTANSFKSKDVIIFIIFSKTNIEWKKLKIVKFDHYLSES